MNDQLKQLLNSSKTNSRKPKIIEYKTVEINGVPHKVAVYQSSKKSTCQTMRAKGKMVHDAVLLAGMSEDQINLL